MDGGRGRGLLGFLLRLLTRECGDLGTVLVHLAEQELTLGADQYRVCIGGRRKVGHTIVPAIECRAQACDVELLGEEVVVQVIAFRRVYGRIELDQHVAGLDCLPVLHPDGAHHPGLEGLDDLGATARHDFSGRRCNDVDRAPPGPGQRRAEQQDDGGPDRTADRRRRRFDDFKRGRQKRQFESIKNYQLKLYYNGQWKAEYDRWVSMLAGMYAGPGKERIAWNQAHTSDMIFTQPVMYDFEHIRVKTLLLIGDADRTAPG